jgi:hypothetical protein
MPRVVLVVVEQAAHQQQLAPQDWAVEAAADKALTQLLELEQLADLVQLL